MEKQYALQKSHGKIIYDNTEPIPETVMMQSQYLKIALTNLIDNAYKFNFEGGSVDILISSVETTAKSGQFTFFVEIVNDTDKHLSTEAINQYLDRAADPKKDHENATNGLLIASKFTQLMGGNLSAEFIEGNHLELHPHHKFKMVMSFQCFKGMAKAIHF